MVGALLIVSAIAAVDSLNPGTIGPALVFAVSSRSVRRVLEFAAAFFVVNVAGGVLLVVGPARWLFDLIPDLGDDAKHALAIAGGLALLAAAVLLLVFRKRLTGRDDADQRRPRGGSALIAGGGIALAELPTALPYFAAIAAIEAADVSFAEELILIVIFNVIFLAPVLAIALLVALFPARVEPFRRWMAQHWPQALAGILAASGIALLVIGI